MAIISIREVIGAVAERFHGKLAHMLVLSPKDFKPDADCMADYI